MTDSTKRCTRCGGEKPATTEFFGKHSYCRDGLRLECRVCAAEYGRTYRNANPEKVAASQKRWREEHPAERAANYRAWNAEHGAEAAKRQREKASALVYDHYGRTCACCGESELLFLTIDHINNDGNTHRRQIGQSTLKLHRYLAKNDFPDGFQVLCRNCNWGKHANGGVCPHETGVQS